MDEESDHELEDMDVENVDEINEDDVNLIEIKEEEEEKVVDEVVVPEPSPPDDIEHLLSEKEEESSPKESGKRRIQFSFSELINFRCIKTYCCYFCCLGYCICYFILSCFCCLIALFLIILAITAAIWNSTYHTIVVSGQTRYYIFHTPEKFRESMNPIPLLFALHGATGNSYQFKSTTDLANLADEKGFVVVFPEGRCSFLRVFCFWDSGFIRGETSEEVDEEIDFLNQLYDELIKDPPWDDDIKIDTNRIWMLGHSNGAMMSLTYATKGRIPLKEIIPISGSISGEIFETDDWYYPPSRSSIKPSVLVVFGDDDDVVPIDGSSEGERIFTGMNTTISYWLEQDSCVAKNVSVASMEKKYDGKNLILSDYSECPNNKRVRSLVISGGEHSWSSMSGQIETDFCKDFCKGSDDLGELIYNLLIS